MIGSWVSGSVVILWRWKDPGMGQPAMQLRPLPYAVGKTIIDLGCRPSYLYQLCSTWHYCRGLVLHFEPITCGQEDATEHGLPM